MRWIVSSRRAVSSGASKARSGYWRLRLGGKEFRSLRESPVGPNLGRVGDEIDRLAALLRGEGGKAARVETLKGDGQLDLEVVDGAHGDLGDEVNGELRDEVREDRVVISESGLARAEDLDPRGGPAVHERALLSVSVALLTRRGDPRGERAGCQGRAFEHARRGSRLAARPPLGYGSGRQVRNRDRKGRGVGAGAAWIVDGTRGSGLSCHRQESHGCCGPWKRRASGSCLWAS